MMVVGKRRPILATATVAAEKGPRFQEPHVVVKCNNDGRSIEDPLTSYHLDISSAKILQLGAMQGPPVKGVLWLEQDEVTAECVQHSPNLVVLAARRPQVGTH
jgi:hypothetical protein